MVRTVLRGSVALLIALGGTLGFAGDPVIDRFLDLYDSVEPGSELIDDVVFDVGS